jgi:hypothetical protein
MKLLRDGSVVLIAALVSLIIGEFTARTSGRVQKIQSGWAWAGSPLRGLQPPGAASEANRFGLRGQDFVYDDKDYVVLLVGDSQVEAPASGMQELPEALLQRALTEKRGAPVKVFSLASSGWSQDQQLLALERYFASYRADVVLVWATPRNDYWENMSPDRSTSKNAGPIKPTYLLDGETPKGPYYPQAFYLYGSALAQLVVQTIYQGQLNQYILDRWDPSLPKASANIAPADCRDTIEMSQQRYFELVFEIDHARKYTITTDEDLEASRSHFSPYTQPETARDAYQKSIARALFAAMHRLAHANKAVFKVFHPAREVDELNRSIACIKTRNGNFFKYQPEFSKLLRETVPADSFIQFSVQGQNDVAVSKSDRHLNALGNTRAMNRLAEFFPF